MTINHYLESILSMHSLLLCVLFCLGFMIIMMISQRNKRHDQQHIIQKQMALHDQQLAALFEQHEKMTDRLFSWLNRSNQDTLAHRQASDSSIKDALRQSQEQQANAQSRSQQQIVQNLHVNAQALSQRFADLQAQLHKQLNLIANQVQDKLSKGLDKNTAIFQDVIKRLTIIDQAQKRIQDLSCQVVDLQDILKDKRSRGAMGELQLSTLLSNMLPANHYALQYTLSNQCRVDCLLKLPQPTGNMAIDAKFPLECYQHMMNTDVQDPAYVSARSQFRVAIKKHINDIADKYIIPGQTADGAMMFIPAEAIFAEIHSHHPQLIELSQHKRVWLVSPTTMMAILTTAQAVIKDVATKKQVHLIQKHLRLLSQDFSRFQKRMGNLSRHIDQAKSDVDEVKISSMKITNHFGKIEAVDLDELEDRTQA